MYRYSGDYSQARAVGDYLRGDPGFGSLLKGAIGIGKKLAGRLPGIGTALTIGGLAKRALIRPSPAVARTVAATALAIPATLGVRAAVRDIPPGQIKVPGIKGVVQRFLPGGATGFRKRPTMNTLNPKALNRAIRRIEGFRSKAVKALQTQGFVVKRRGGAGLTRRGQMACGCPKGKCNCN